MQWFKHDTDAITDAKIKKLIMRFGADGYAIYFHCIELIVGNVSEQNITFELEHDAEIIADNLKIKGTSDTSPVDRVNQIMRYIVSLGLFDESNGHIFCYKILKRLDSSMTSNAKMRTIISNAKQRHDKIMISHDTVMQEENRIDENRQEENKEETPDKPAATSKPKRVKKEFMPPTQEEVTDYILEKKLVIDPYKFIDWYTKTDWKDNQGNQIKNWKNKAINWDSREKEKNPAAVPYSKTPIPEKRTPPEKKKCPKCGGDIRGSACVECYTNYDYQGNEI